MTFNIGGARERIAGRWLNDSPSNQYANTDRLAHTDKIEHYAGS